MKSGETGYLKVSISGLTSQLLNLTSKIVFSIKSKSAFLQKEYPGAVLYEAGAFLIPLTQEETTKLTGNYQVEAQINFNDKSVSKSNIESGKIADTLNTIFVDGNAPSNTGINTISLSIDPVQIVSEGGTSDYTDLENKPKINSVTLTGNKSAPDLGLASATHTHSSSDVSGLSAVATSGSYSDLSNKPTLSTVATSGSYNDLSNKPAIPTYTAGTGISIENNVISATGGGASIDDTATSASSTWSSEKISTEISNSSGISIQTRTYSEGYGNGATNTVVYWDEIDNAWLFGAKVNKNGVVDAGQSMRLCKMTTDGAKEYSAPITDEMPLALSVYNSDGSLNRVETTGGTGTITDIKRVDEYYFVTIRSGEPNVPSDGVATTNIWGYLGVYKASDLSLAQSISFNAKCSNVNVLSSSITYIKPKFPIWVVVSCQMSYFQIFKVSKAEDGTLSFNGRTKTCFRAFENVASGTDVQTGIQEFQVAKSYYNSSAKKSYLISAGFADGIHIVDFSSIGSTGKRGDIYTYSFKDNTLIPKEWTSEIAPDSKGSTFEVDIDYPYVYCSWAQPTAVIKAYNDGLGDYRVQGMIVLDITDLTNIQAQFHRIPLSDCQNDTGGDPKPCSIVKRGKNVFLGMGNRGVARFEVNGLNATYKGLIPMGITPCVRHIAINRDLELFCKASESTSVDQYGGYGVMGAATSYNKIGYNTVIDVSRFM